MRTCRQWLPVLAVVALLSGVTEAQGSIITTLMNPTNGHTYHLLSQNTWTASQAEALALGGNLVTINDAAENAWVFTSFANYGGVMRSIWIGLNDAANEGTFTWASGEAASYTAWASGEPNNNGNEDFVALWASPYLNAGQWNDFADVTSYTRDTFIIPMHGVVEIAAVVPEPCGLISAALGFATMAGYAGWNRGRRFRPC